LKNFSHNFLKNLSETFKCSAVQTQKKKESREPEVGIQVAAFSSGMKDKKQIKTLNEVRKEHILRILKDTNWDIEKASRILNVSPRFLKNELKRYKLEQS